MEEKLSLYEAINQELNFDQLMSVPTSHEKSISVLLLVPALGVKSLTLKIILLLHFPSCKTDRKGE